MLVKNLSLLWEIAIVSDWAIGLRDLQSDVEVTTQSSVQGTSWMAMRFAEVYRRARSHLHACVAATLLPRLRAERRRPFAYTNPSAFTEHD